MKWLMTCVQCFFAWHDELGQMAVHYSGCPKCKSKYWRCDVPRQVMEDLIRNEIS